MTEKEELSKTSDTPTPLGSAALWYVKPEDNKGIKRNKTIPCRRWGHASASVDNNYYVYGGTGDKTSSFYWESIYRLDLETWEWINLEAINNPPNSRDSHSMTICHNKLYIFGGSSDNESTNDLYEYDLATSMWKQVEVKGSVVTPREGHAACLYENRYLVIHGGWNGEETLGDCYLFDIPNSTWIRVEKNIGKEATPRESHSCGLLKDHMYLFGGQGNSETKDDESKEVFLNDLYKFKIIFENNTATASWEKLEPAGPIPPHRSSHSVCTYKDRYMFIVGGEGYPKPGEGPTDSDLKQSKSRDEDADSMCYPKNDVWFYDIEVNNWYSLKVKNSPEFIGRFAHSCNTFKDCLVIFGGLKDYHHSLSDVCVLSLDGSNPLASMKAPVKAKKDVKPIVQETEKPKPQVLNKGSIKGKIPQVDFNLLGPTHHGGRSEPSKDTVDESVTELEGPLVSISFLHSLASIISWPLAAFGLLLENSLINKASTIKIDVWSKKRKSPEMSGIKMNEGEIAYLTIEDDGKGWKHNDFINIFMKYDTDPSDTNALLVEEPEVNVQDDERKKRINEYAFNLKVAGFRLGRTIIYISKSDDEISVGFISVDKRFNPDIHGNHVFLYSWKRSTQEYLTSQAQKNKDIILKALTGIFTEDDFLENIDKYSNRVFILDLNPVATSKTSNGKGQDYELLFFKKGVRSNDIMIRTLDKNLKNFYTDQTDTLIELSLRTYLSHFFLDPTLANIEIFINENPVSFVNVKESIDDRNNEPVFNKLSEEGLFDAYLLLSYAQKEAKEQQKDSSAAGNKRRSKAQKSLIEKREDLSQGILVYFENRLIRRLETPKLGNLDFLSFQTRQVQNIKQGQGLSSLFAVNGYIEVKNYMKPNMFKTEIENPYYSNYLYSTLVPKIQALSTTNSNDKRRLEGASDEYDVVSKKVKPNLV